MKRRRWKREEMKDTLGKNNPAWNLGKKYGFAYVTVPKGYELIGCREHSKFKPSVISIDLIKKKRMRKVI